MDKKPFSPPIMLEMAEDVAKEALEHAWEELCGKPTGRHLMSPIGKPPEFRTKDYLNYGCGGVWPAFRIEKMKPNFEPPTTAIEKPKWWENPAAAKVTATGLEAEATYARLQIERMMQWHLNDALGIPTELFPGENSTRSILRDLGEKEDESMEMSLNARKIKEVTIKCEDGKTYEGKVERIVGCPYDISSQELTVRISKRASGNYGIKEVIFQNPATIVFWTDGTKTVVNCMDNAEIKKKIVDGKEVTVRRARKCDTYSEEAGLAMAIVKKYFGNEGNYNNVFRKFIPGMAEREKAAKKAAKKAKKTEE